MEGCGCSSHPASAPSWEHCRRCGSLPSEDNPISSRGICLPCADKAVYASIYEMRQRKGPYWNRYVKGRAKSALRQLSELPD